MTLIASIGPLIDVAQQTDPSQAAARYRTAVAGLQMRPALISHDGQQEGVAIELTPAGSRALLGLPARELWNTTVELSDVAGGSGDELWERLQVGAAWEDRFAVCDQTLLRLVREADVVPALGHAWRSLVGTGGTVSVEDLADEVGWSRQHLARRFRDEFGLGPKAAARLVRFERARKMLASTPPFVGLAGVAAACGYYDQAHLNQTSLSSPAARQRSGCARTSILPRPR